jgi:NTE family protein
MAMGRYPKIGIALGSGGAKGLAHIGVLKTLEKHGIPISIIAGSSIGALIGSYYAAHPYVEDLEDFILSFTRRTGFSLFDPTLRGGLIRGNKIEHLIGELLDGSTFASLRIPFAAVATDFNTAESVIISEGDLVKAVRASISVPAVFQPVVYADRLLADGGLSDPVPDEVARKMGSEIVIAVNLDRVYSPSVVITKPSLAKVSFHSINILRHNLALYSLRTADVVISPRIDPLGLIGWNYFFDTEKAKELIKAGEDATEKIIPQLRALIKEKQHTDTGISKLVAFFRRL